MRDQDKKKLISFVFMLSHINSKKKPSQVISHISETEELSSDNKENVNIFHPLIHHPYETFLIFEIHGKMH